MTLALWIEKSWYTQKIHHTRQHLHALEHERTGLFVRNEEGFSFSKLASLLQEIARAKLEEIRFMLFVEHAEEKLRGGCDGTTLFGSPALAARPVRHLQPEI
jgi:hypothetical protein